MFSKCHSSGNMSDFFDDTLFGKSLKLIIYYWEDIKNMWWPILNIIAIDTMLYPCDKNPILCIHMFSQTNWAIVATKIRQNYICISTTFTVEDMGSISVGVINFYSNFVHINYIFLLNQYEWCVDGFGSHVVTRVTTWLPKSYALTNTNSTSVYEPYRFQHNEMLGKTWSVLFHRSSHSQYTFISFKEDILSVFEPDIFCPFPYGSDLRGKTESV